MSDTTKLQDAGDRQEAMAYLQTASRTTDAAVRHALRRRAAELILPRGDEPAEELLDGEDDGAQGPGRPRDFS